MSLSKNNQKTYVILGVTVIIIILACVFVIYNINKPKEDLNLEENQIQIEQTEDVDSTSSGVSGSDAEVPAAPVPPSLELPTGDEISNQGE